MTILKSGAISKASFNVRLILVDGAVTKDIDSYGPAKAELKELFDQVLARSPKASAR